MKFPTVSRFFYYITNKYQVSRKELAKILGLEMTTVYNFVAGFSSPRRRVLVRLANYLGEEWQVFEGLCFPPDKKHFTGGNPSFPNLRFDIVTHCDCKWARREIIKTDYTHILEAYVSGYGMLLMEDEDPWTNATRNQVLTPDFCRQAMKALEGDVEKRRHLTRILGRWIPIVNEQIYFEFAPARIKPVHFFNSPEAAVNWKTRVTTLNLEEERLMSLYRKLPDSQKARIKETIQEKLAFVSMSEKPLPPS